MLLVGHQKMGGSKMLMMGVVAMVTVGEAQDFPSCTPQLPPCLDFINSTTPPNTCCNPLKDIVANDLSCIRQLYTTPALLESFGLNITTALPLSRRCGVTIAPHDCNPVAPPPTSTTPVKPPATPGADGGGAGSVAFTGLSFLHLFWASVLFN